ncbi:HipA N-terminal domain-containing protein [Polaribacter sp. R2A056_3_33]|jgi:serine/threonine-protein kinase HipA|uniref:HipA N-terminal domain-containing protein n=1 Tax=Polaribacter sp. R2A056_3_33 TaxID=2745563 RepID=UPI001C4F7525|nr:HipA N-terminal domain-containing protein [Polaribacter sp. R2A056_3_33]QXP70745.1 HipA N-terminal domain-containing protein [Polaribacter sp. R2A056_3_33]
MRQAQVLYKKEAAGVLTQLDDGNFIFTYHDKWFHDSTKPAISLTLPKTQQDYTSTYLFPFFYNMLPEGTNKQTVCFENRIDTKDHFGILITTAKYDTIGAVQIHKINN